MQDNTATTEPTTPEPTGTEIPAGSNPVPPSPAPAGEGTPPAVPEATAEAQTASEKPGKPEEVAGYSQWRTGDAGVDGALGLLEEAGVSFSDAQAIFGKAIASGNPADIDKALLAEKAGPQKAAVVSAAVQAWYAAQTAAMEQTARDVYAAVPGGEAGWAKVRDWAVGKQADPQFAPVLAEVREMLDRGGVAAIAAAKHLADLYSRAPGTVGAGNRPPIMGTGATAGAAAPLEIPRREFNDRLAAAYRSGDAEQIRAIRSARLV